MTTEEFIKSLGEIKVGMRIQVPEEVSLGEVHMKLTDQGYTAPMNLHYRDIYIHDYLLPATRNSEGFLIENDALAARLRRELRNEPYNRQDDSIFPLLLSEEQRGGNPDVIGFIPGERTQYGYSSEYMYISSKVLYYSNLEHCIRKIIQDFDIYGFGYVVSWTQWKKIKEIAELHGKYAAGVAGEIDDWLQGASTVEDPAMTIMCI